MSQLNLLPLVEAVEVVTGRRVHLSTVWRWCTRGASGVRLESKALGRKRFTTTESVIKFMDEVARAKDSLYAPVVQVTPKQSERAAAASAAKLKAVLSSKN